ncbi:DUF6538 domain-containing protein [Jiella avicenniae]|uniref:DUF6538 domain-containing protein n=1 Tax=Jiella avicenniae TaxID=2907202 RepID=UPI003B8463B1
MGHRTAARPEFGPCRTGLHTAIARRGAVYYWRKRLPNGLAERIGVTHVKFSLKTRETKEARYLGACLNARAADVVKSEPPTISREQLKSLNEQRAEAGKPLSTFDGALRPALGFLANP